MSTKQESVCLVGTGRWGSNHLRTLHELGALGAVVERAAARREEAAAQYGVPVYADVKEAIADGHKAYIVAVPAAYHYAVTEPLLRAGASVLVEKPMTLSSTDAERMLQLAQEHDAHLMVGHLLLFHPAIMRFEQLVSEGAIGELLYLYSNRLNFGTLRSEEDAFWSLAPHDISLFDFIVKSPISRTSASGGDFLQTGIADRVVAQFRYQNGVVAHIFTSWLHPFKEHRLVAVGREGMLVYEDSSPKKELLLYKQHYNQANGEWVKNDGGVEVIPYEPKLPLTEELRYFMAGIGKGYTKANGKQGAEVVRVLERVSALLEEESK